MAKVVTDGIDNVPVVAPQIKEETATELSIRRPWHSYGSTS